ncbi:MAG: DUF5605 domain-containing protein [Tepidisphaeraceae bacterium]
MATSAHTTEQQTVEQWDFVDIALAGPSDGNPFIDVDLSAAFTHESGAVLRVRGFYDDEGVYRIRFMPTLPGRWSYVTASNAKALDGQRGEVSATAPTGNNHGPVRVANTFHFAYADGTPFKQIGTTAYAWTHQGPELERQTLDALRSAPFNKVRMCVFPKNYAFNEVEPPRYPFVGTPPTSWDFTRFNVDHFRHFEQHVGTLRDMGIEADVILFHPYDKGRWGFDRMDAASDDRYLKYVIARLAAYRNVWWSMANEYDFMKEKQPADWDRYFQITQATDPYDHLRSIHNGFRIYDHNKPWVTHVSLQNGSALADFGRAVLYRDCWYKPIVGDEVKYEGNLPQRWGNISAEEMVHRFWQGTIAGIYVGHGETYLHPEHVIWWARGGPLRGQSPARLNFLRDVLDAGPATGIDPIDKWQDERTAGKAGEYYLIYFGHETPTEWLFELPRQELIAGTKFKAELLDTWNMTIENVPGEFEIIADTTYRYHAKALPKIDLPGRPFMAIRLTRTALAAAPTGEGEHIYGES